MGVSECVCSEGLSLPIINGKTESDTNIEGGHRLAYKKKGAHESSLEKTHVFDEAVGVDLLIDRWWSMCCLENDA